MSMYVVYNRKTGEIVHSHAEPEDMKTPREEILSLVDPSHDASQLEVALVDPEAVRVDKTYRMDVVKGRLTALRKEKKAGFGTGGCQSPDRPAIVRPVRTVIEREPPEPGKTR